MGMTYGFEETKRTGDYNIVQRKICSQRQNWIWFSVQPERIYKLPGEKKNNIDIYTYIYNMHNCCWWLVYLEICCFVCYFYHIKFWIT